MRRYRSNNAHCTYLKELGVCLFEHAIVFRRCRFFIDTPGLRDSIGMQCNLIKGSYFGCSRLYLLCVNSIYYINIGLTLTCITVDSFCRSSRIF